MKSLNKWILLLLFAVTFSQGSDLQTTDMQTSDVNKPNSHSSNLNSSESLNHVDSLKSKKDISSSTAVTKEITGNQKFVCKSGAVERSLENAKKGSGCEVIYTKQGQAKTIALQKLGTLRCDDVFQTLLVKLNKSGFACEPK